MEAQTGSQAALRFDEVIVHAKRRKARGRRPSKTLWSIKNSAEALRFARHHEGNVSDEAYSVIGHPWIAEIIARHLPMITRKQSSWGMLQINLYDYAIAVAAELGKLPAPSLCEQPTRNDIISAFEAYNEEAWDIINRLTYDPLYFHEERLNVQFNSLWQAREEIAKRISFLTRLSKLTGKPVPSIQDLVNGPWLNLAYRLLMNQQ